MVKPIAAAAIVAGGNYGWPTYGYGRDNKGSPMPPPGEGIEQAWITWNPGIDVRQRPDRLIYLLTEEDAGR